jgi:bacterioferritin
METTMARKTTSKADTNIISLLIGAYNAEMETVMNYLSTSVNLEGVRASHIKESLDEDIGEELGHAKMLAKRIHTLGGLVPGSQSLKWTQKALQTRRDTTDVTSVIKAVIAAENDAIALYEEIIRATDQLDWVTQELAIGLLGDEQEHRREFESFLKEYETK